MCIELMVAFFFIFNANDRIRLWQALTHSFDEQTSIKARKFRFEYTRNDVVQKCSPLAGFKWYSAHASLVKSISN